MERAEILNRYSRQMLVPNFGISGQEKLIASKVLVVGAGGIGSTVCMYLASAGVTIHIMDHDSVELSNLHR
jgi:adenylyltransferase/sulfurtransferase